MVKNFQTYGTSIKKIDGYTFFESTSLFFESDLFLQKIHGGFVKSTLAVLFFNKYKHLGRFQTWKFNVLRAFRYIRFSNGSGKSCVTESGSFLNEKIHVRRAQITFSFLPSKFIQLPVLCILNLMNLLTVFTCDTTLVFCLLANSYICS